MTASSRPVGRGWVDSAAVFGYDFFISFVLGPPPRGTQSYSSDLARRLRERDYTVFFSEDEAAPGAVLDSTLRRALRRSRVLIVIANTAALRESKWVPEEVKEFRARHPKRPIVPINVANALEECRSETEKWLAHERTIWLDESAEAVAQGITSPETVQRLVVTPRSMKARTRMRVTLVAIAMVLSGLTLIAWWQANEARVQRDVAISRQLAAQSVSESTTSWSRSILLALAAPLIASSVEARASLLAAALGLPRHLTFLWGHDRAVRTVAFSPDGQVLASGGEDGRVILWNVTTRQQIGEPLKQDGHVWSVAFSPDGKRLVSAGMAGVVVWDVAARKPLNQPVPERKASSVSFRPNGALFMTGHGDGTIAFSDALTGEPLGEPLQAHEGAVLAVAFSPDNTKFATGGDDRQVLLWDIRRQRRTALEGHTEQVASLAFSPDGRLLASGSSDETIILWNTETGERVGSPLEGMDGIVMGLAFSRDGAFLVASSYHNKVVLWSVAERRAIDEPLGRHERDGVSSVAFSHDGLLASGGGDGTVIISDLTSRHPLAEGLDGPSQVLSSVAYGAGGKLLAAGSAAKTVLLWDLASGQRAAAALNGHAQLVVSVAFSPDGGLLASGGSDGMVLLWDVAQRSPIKEPLVAHTGSVRVAFSPDGRLLATGAEDGQIVLWDVPTRKRDGPPLKMPEGNVLSIAFSPDGRFLAAGGAGNTIVLWDVRARQPLGPPLDPGAGAVHGLAFSPSGALLAAATGTRSVSVWTIPDGNAVEPVTTERAGVMSVAFSPDGGLLALGSNQIPGGAENKVILVDFATRRQLGEFAQTCPIFEVAFNPDGSRLTTASYCEGITLWRVDDASWRSAACTAVNRSLNPAQWHDLAGDSVPFSAVCPGFPTFSP